MIWFRFGLLAYRERGLLVRLLFLLVAVLAGVPVIFVLALFGGLSTSPSASAVGAAAKPMSSWTITQEFGCTGVLLEGPRGACPHFHSGIDLAAAAGTPVYAVLPGVAEVVYSVFGFGNHVLLHHGGDMVTLYGHLLAATVVNGQAVAAGAVIGFEGSTGNSSGPHLHFEVRAGTNPVPPRTVFPGLFGPGPSATGVGPGPARNSAKGRTSQWSTAFS